MAGKNVPVNTSRAAAKAAKAPVKEVVKSVLGGDAQAVAQAERQKIKAEKLARDALKKGKAEADNKKKNPKKKDEGLGDLLSAGLAGAPGKKKK